MARYCGPSCRFCRREGEKLHLKGDRCFSDKCSFERRKYAPGQHGQKRTKQSDYAIQLREKQKIKRIYTILEKQFRNYYKKASQKKGVTGENLIRFVELRLDNIVHRMGFGSSRSQARQLVNHGHFLVNGKKVDIPSYILKAGDQIELRQKSDNLSLVSDNLSNAEHRGLPEWLEVDVASKKGKIRHIPSREEIPLVANEQLIVEFYSK